MDNYVIGKPEDFARSALGKNLENFTPYDFAVMDTAAFEETPEDFWSIADCSEGWYGIKKLTPDSILMNYRSLRIITEGAALHFSVWILRNITRLLFSSLQI